MGRASLVGLLAALAAQPVVAASVVAVRPIRAMTVVSAADLELRPDSVAGAVASIEAAVGLEAKQTLYPGRPILEAQLGPPAVVERNEVVRMVFSTGPLAISTEGRALDRGGAGELIRVMNVESRQIVTGAVLPDGTIEVGK